VFPEGIAVPSVSNLNFSPGQTVANLVTVPLSSSGMVSIYNHAGITNVVVDVEGYYTSTPLGNKSGLFNSLSPVRALVARSDPTRVSLSPLPAARPAFRPTRPQSWSQRPRPTRQRPASLRSTPLGCPCRTPRASTLRLTR
jgi:hypothetical protein